MIQPTAEEIEQHISEAGLHGQLPASTVVLIRDVLLPSRFPSWSCLLDVDGVWQAWPCRTVPSAGELQKSGRHRDGTAIIAPGVMNAECWQPGWHSPGKHGKSRPCLRQCSQILVHRDSDGDAVAEWSISSQLWDNAAGINLHDWRGSSAGCPTMEEQATVDELLAACALHNVQRWSMVCIEPLLTCESI